MEDDLSRLESLSPYTGYHDKTVVTERSREGMWEYVREAVNTLFRALSGHWKCKCSHLHRPYLRLDPREAARVGQHLQFRLTLLSESSPAHPSPWRCRSIEVESKSMPLSAPPPASPQAVPNASDGMKLQQKKRVRLTDLVPKIDSVDSTMSAVMVYSTTSILGAHGIAPSKPLVTTSDKLTVVNSLCATFTQSSRLDQVELDESHWQHRLSTQKTTAVSGSADPDSNYTSRPLFEQLLLSSKHQISAPTITVREKYVPQDFLASMEARYHRG